MTAVNANGESLYSNAVELPVTATAAPAVVAQVADKGRSGGAFGVMGLMLLGAIAARRRSRGP